MASIRIRATLRPFATVFPGTVLPGTVLAVAVSGLAAALLSGSGVGSAAASSAPGRTELSPSAAACVHTAPGQVPTQSRLRPGSTKADADTLTSTQVAGEEAQTTRRAAALGLAKNSAGQLARAGTSPAPWIALSPDRTASSSGRTATKLMAPRAAARAVFSATTVPVYFHIVTDGTSGKLSSSTVAKQIAVLNAAYASAGFSFRLARTDTTTNRDWFNTTGPSGSGSNGDAADARAMKTKLHVGSTSTLNIYSVRFSDQTLGYSTFPFGGASALDGTVIDYRSLPGGSFTGYNLGDTATHEIGHWFGLYHTFQGGCSATAGDYVSDTPAEAYPAWDCTPKDSCPTLPGTDPIKNFMDYAPDACMNTFTPGQRTRMQNEWLTYRSPAAAARR